MHRFRAPILRSLTCEGVDARTPALPCTCCSPQVQAANQRIATDLSRRMFLGGAAALVAPFLACAKRTRWPSSPRRRNGRSF